MTSHDESGETSDRLAPVSFLPWVSETASPGRPTTDDTGVGASAGSFTNANADAAADVDADADAERDRVDRILIQRLRRRGLSIWEVTEILRENNVPETEFDDWVGRLESLGYVDDAALAEQIVATHHHRKGLGTSAVAQELMRRHIDPGLIEAALAGIDSDDELARATELATKRAGQLASYDSQTVYRRLHGFLTRKGYSSSIVRQAIGAAISTNAGSAGGAAGTSRGGWNDPSGGRNDRNGRGGGRGFR